MRMTHDNAPRDLRDPRDLAHSQMKTEWFLINLILSAKRFDETLFNRTDDCIY